MKKIVLGILIALFALVLIVALAVHFFLDGAIKTEFEKVGPKITKVETRLGSVSLSIMSGSGKMKGLKIGNPEGFKTPSAIQVSSSSFTVKPGSLLSDKIIVKSVNIEQPEITCEITLQGNNLKKLLSNVEESTGSSSKEPARAPAQTKEPSDKPAKKLQVDEFIITGAKLNVNANAPLIGQKSYTVPISDIHLPPLGQGPEGVTAAEVSRIALQAILEKAIAEAEKIALDMAKGGQFMGKDLGTNSSGAIQNATKGLGDLLNKKK